jgi:hypothetical protein
MFTLKIPDFVSVSQTDTRANLRINQEIVHV